MQALGDLDLSKEYRALLPDLGVLLGIPCVDQVTLTDNTRQGLDDDEFDRLESMMQEAVQAMEVTAAAGRNKDEQADKRRRQVESTDLFAHAIRPAKRAKNRDEEGLDAHRGEAATELPEPEQSTAQDPLTSPQGSTPKSHAFLLGADTQGEAAGASKGNDSGGTSRATLDTPRKAYRPPLSSLYHEPELGPDLLEGSDWIYEHHGKSLRQATADLPPRADIIEFDTNTDDAELMRNLSLKGCPENLHQSIVDVIKEYWDVFCQRGLRRPIRGFSFQIDTGNTPPVCCRSPRYGQKETPIINHLTTALHDNGLIEEDDGPWGAQIVLAAKPGQHNVPLEEFKWRLTISYRRLNQVTRPFAFNIPRCDDAVEEIDAEAQYFIVMDMDSGYWQIMAEPEARAKLAFFTPAGKMRWKVMPMGALNSASTFVAMMMKLRRKWNALAAERGVPHVGSQVIVDDVLLHGRTPEALLQYFRCVLEVLKHHRATLNLKKCRFMIQKCEFVGIDVAGEGNKPAESKYEAFERLERPITFSDLRILIGFFGFYSRWLWLFESRIRPWRDILMKQPRPGTMSPVAERHLMTQLWTQQHSDLLTELKTEVIAGPVLARPDPKRRFYVKTDWSKNKMGTVLCQADPSAENLDAEIREAAGEKCHFDRTKAGPRLRPVIFLDRKTTPAERSYHSYVGEAATGRWAIGKFRKYLWGAPFTWLTDCSGLRFFFEGDVTPNHVTQRWRAELLQYNFTIEHRPAAMLTDCDSLTRYNTATEQWREENSEENSGLPTPNATPEEDDNDRKLPAKERPKQGHTAHVATTKANALFPSDDTPAAFTVSPVTFAGDARGAVSERRWDPHRTAFVVGARGVPTEEAFDAIGIHGERAITHAELEGREHSWPTQNVSEFQNWISQAAPTETPLYDWLVAVYTGKPQYHGRKDDELTMWCGQILDLAAMMYARCSISAVIILCPLQWPDVTQRIRRLRHPIPDWSYQSLILRNTQHGGAIETDHRVLCLLPSATAAEFIFRDSTTAGGEAMNPWLDHDDGRPWDELDLRDMIVSNPDPTRCACETVHSHSVRKLIKHRGDANPPFGHPVFSPEKPAPSIATRATHEEFFDAPFAVWFEPDSCRSVRTHEVWRLLGLSDQHTQAMLSADEADALERARVVPGKAGLEALFFALRLAEANAAAKTPPSSNVEQATPLAFPAVVLDPATTLPLPTEDQWRQATAQDADLQLVIAALQPQGHLNRADLVEKGYHTAWKAGQLELDNGILYHYDEPHRARLRLLRTRVVPPSLRRAVVSACHVSPMAGHSGARRTFWRLFTRFWWPSLSRDTYEAVTGCAHCRLANNASHEAQMRLYALPCDTPFDVVFLDVWSPGEVTEKDGSRKILTMLDCMTGFAAGTTLMDEVTSEVLAVKAFTAFFVSYGLPRLIIVDADGLFQSVFVELFRLLHIPVEAVSRENHKAVRNERFHRYLNKVETINTADKESFHQWLQGVLFALYAWNAGPIDGTDVPRSYAAIGREFPFPIDLSPDTPTDVTGDADSALDHCDAATPLLYKQRRLLNVLNDERRRRHRELKNEGVTQRTFEPGDLVIVRKQVKSRSAEGISAKLTFKARGPYRVIEPAHAGSYWLQKLPFLQGLGRPGRRMKQSAARMEKIPSTLILHKHADGADTRFASFRSPLAPNPLEKWLGVLDRGAYRKAEGNPNWAFEPLASMWSDEIEDEDDDDNSDDDDNHDDDNNDNDNDNPDTVGATTERAGNASDVPDPPRAPLSRSDRAALRRFQRTIRDSTDKLFFIKYRPTGTLQFRWYLVQVDEDNTNPIAAREFGVYRVRWYIPHHQDLTKRTLAECRWWPEIREQIPTTSGARAGKHLPTQPNKAQKLIDTDDTVMWFQDDVHLAEFRLVGPFDFSTIRITRGPQARVSKEEFHIDNIYWQELERIAPSRDIDVSNIRAAPTDRRR